LDVYPSAEALRLSLLKYHQFPWWNPWSCSGTPFFAHPQVAVLTPETVFVTAFGAVLGLKITIISYAIVGYEGTRALCRYLFDESPFVEAICVIPALMPALALHFNEGHADLLAFYSFPWLVALAPKANARAAPSCHLRASATSQGNE
jgi:hypothetical protein